MKTKKNKKNIALKIILGIVCAGALATFSSNIVGLMLIGLILGFLISISVDIK
jgi:hypothetical protein